MNLDKDHAVLMVIDMQNSFCSTDGGCARIGMPVTNLIKAVEPCRQLIETARLAGVPVIYTRYICKPDYSDAGLLFHELMPELMDVAALAAGTSDVEIVATLQPEHGDYVIDKNRPSAFFAARLESVLKELGAEQLVVCGVTTNCCVESTVRDASQRDYQTFVVVDAVAELEEDRHAVALRSMAMLFADVITLKQVRMAWE